MAGNRDREYDAFVAYSHAGKAQVAAQVVRGLETFAKPWYRARSVRIFRDVTSLAASPGLWSAIEQALLASRYLIVVLTPEAATSPWVNQEIEVFLKNRGPERILLVLADGDLLWDAHTGEFDRRRSTALPAALVNAFRDEPLWVDLRPVADNPDLSLRDPTLQGGVAQLAAVLSGVTKDELVGEDLSQRRRSLRLVQATIATLTILLLTTVTSLFLALKARTSTGPSDATGWATWVLLGLGAILLPVLAVGVSDWLRRQSAARGVGQPTASKARPLRLAWLREIDLYIGPTDPADRELAQRVAAAVQRLGQPRRLWWGRPRVYVDRRDIGQVDDLADSHLVARRARHYLHLATARSANAEAPNLIIQDWLGMHPPERLLVGTSGGPGLTDEVIPAVVRAAGIDLSARWFDLRPGFGEASAASLGMSARGVSESARLIGFLLGVDPYLVVHGGLSVLRVARRRARIEEPLERWNIAHTVGLREQARASVHLPEVQSAMAALGQSPLAFYLDVLADEEQLTAQEIRPRAQAMLAQAERSASRETSIRVGRPRHRNLTKINAVAGAGGVLLFGTVAVAGLIPPDRSWLWLLAAVVAALSAVTPAFLQRRAEDFEVRRQRTFMTTYAEAVTAAAESLEDSLPETVLLPYLRQRINEELSRAGTVAVKYDPTILTSQTLERFRLETAAQRRAMTRIEAPGGGAIGLAGPRGAGKTTLLSALTRTRFFHRPESPDSQLGVLIAAPVRYEAPDFIAQVLAAVCRETIRAANRGQRLTPHGYLSAVTSPTRRILAAVLLVAALTAIPFVAGWVVVDRRELLLVALSIVAAGSVAVLLDVTNAARRIRLTSRYTPGPTTGKAIPKSAAERIRDLTAAASTILNRLYYREERSLSAVVKLAVPLGLEANSTGKYEGRQWTTAEIIQQFRQFVGALNDCGYRVLIAIDELDKVDDDQEVIRLLNDLKTLFGLGNCYFMVAVSISAMVRFQQRGLPFQDAFESALDEVIYVEPLTATETVELLQRRLTGIPTPTALMCHVVGAGLPRDIIRALRNLAAGTEQRPSDVALRALVLDDLDTRLAAARTRLQLEGQEAGEPVRKLLDLAQTPFDVRKWSATVDPMLDEARQRLPAAQSREDDRLLLYCGWAITAADLADYLAENPGANSEEHVRLAQDLATCRRMLAIDLRDAYQTLAEVRAVLAPRRH